MGVGRRGKTGVDRVLAKKNRKLALALRAQGLTLEDIGHKLGISKGYASKLISAELAKFDEDIAANREELRTMELLRCEKLQEQLAPKVLKGDIKAILATLKVMERRAKLYGLDMPAKIAWTDEEGNDVLEGKGLANLLKAVTTRGGGR